jgi:hypothetical protein
MQVIPEWTDEAEAEALAADLLTLLIITSL